MHCLWPTKSPSLQVSGSLCMEPLAPSVRPWFNCCSPAALRSQPQVPPSIWVTKRSIIFPIPSRAQSLLAEIRQRLETGAFKPLLDREYLLSETRRAFEYVETGKKVGNVLIAVDSTQRGRP